MDKPKLYSKCNNMQKTDNIFVLDTYLPLIEWKTDADSVLDVGCGDGSFSIDYLIPKLPKNIGKFVGCDLSEAMVDFAKENYGSAQRDFVKFDIASDEVLVGFEEKFKYIFSFFALHWVGKQRQAFENLYKMLAPGGEMLLTFIATHPFYNIFEKMTEYPKWKQFLKREYIGTYHYSENREKELEDLLVEVGFVPRVCKVEKRNYVYPTLEIFEKSAVAINPIIPKLPPADVNNCLSDFLNEVRKMKSNFTFTNIINDTDESVETQYELFVVLATKPM